MDFRRDINGLRAVAVLAVVLFHFGIPGLSGGFVGVDIFFVISGFLMTGIIFSKINNNKFSIFSFYLDRCRRIIPALAVLSGTLLVLGCFLLIPEELKTLGKHVGASLMFLSNIVFWRENGYFDLASHEKWMLHTWSLSVEWQFYILYPVLILFLRKAIGLNKSRFAIAACAILSFLLSVYASSAWPGAAFYLLPTRAWEMLAGALIYLFPITLGKRTSFVFEVLGLFLIAVSIVLFNSESIWPGWLALVPVLGASLVIYSSRSNSMVMCNGFLQVIGKSSYSIYLWHWPLAVFITYWGLKGQVSWVVGCIVLSILMGYLSYRLVENTAGKNAKNFFGFSPVAKVFVLLGCAGSLASVVFVANGFPARMGSSFAQETKDLVMPLPDNGWCFYGVDSSRELTVGDKGLKCILGKKGASQKGILFGDSYAGHNAPFWDVIGKDLSLEINSVSTNWCFPSLSDDFTGPTSSRAYEQCLINRKYLLGSLSEYDVVVFAGSWGSVFEQGKMHGLHDAIALAANKSKLVVLMAAPTAFDVNVKYRYERSLLFRTGFDISMLGKEKDVAVKQANDELKVVSEKYKNVIYLSRGSLFNVDGNPSDVTAENIPYSLDGGHISVYGSIMSAHAFEGTSSYDDLKRRVSSFD
jgi:peptidoglycan/LPS O-acetylase OafA/YrhL